MNTQNSQKTEKKRVAILGGSFNPVTIGHLQMAAELLNNALVETVWLVPCGQRQDKFIIENSHRLRMLELAIEEFFGDSEFDIQIHDAEIRNGETIPTYDLMKQFESNYPEYDFAFVVGSDLIEGMPKWNKGLLLLKQISFYIFQRPGYHLEKDSLPTSYHIIQAVSISSSSTEVRDRIGKAKVLNRQESGAVVSQKAKGTLRFQNKYLGVYGIIPQRVIEYIKKNNLY